MSISIEKLLLDVSVMCVRRIMDAISPAEPDALALIQSPRARAFAAFMLARFNVRLHVKNTVLMRVAAAGFDVATVFGANVPDGEAFMRYGTTIGPEVFLPEAVLTGSDEELISMLTHEIEHAAQFWDKHAAFIWLYATEPEARAGLEANAYGAGMEARFAVSGRVFPPEQMLPDLVASYHVREGDQRLALVMMQSLCESASHGVLTTFAGTAAVRWLRANP